MRVFYDNWLAGKSKQEAFKEAQKTLRGSNQFSAPVYWAAFIMMD
jgi:CHAT domain-containing protein